MNNTPKFYGLDHLRALAIFLVFFYHYDASIFGHPQWLDEPARFGWTGVDLFFVLSGFLISSQLFAQVRNGGQVKLGEFFVKRFLRILPAFWVVVAIYFLWPGFHEREALAPLWRYLLFVQNIELDLKQTATFSHAWSLCVEEHFYLFLPFILALLAWSRLFKRSYWLLILLFAGTIILRYYAYEHIYLPATAAERAWAVWYRAVYYPTWCRLDGLVVGVGIAAVHTFLPAVWQSIESYGNWLLLVGLLILTGSWFLVYEEHSFQASVFGFATVSIGYGLLVMAALSSSCFLYRWKSRVTSWIAALSFSIYLSHKGVIHITQVWLADNGVDIDSGLCMAVCTLTCVLAAIMLHLLVERPFMNLRKRILKPKTVLNKN